tara:strand:+ start:105 stop:206 length:102 start_codon:yes stop_codon:yes gene_type:complete
VSLQEDDLPKIYALLEPRREKREKRLSDKVKHG